MSISTFFSDGPGTRVHVGGPGLWVHKGYQVLRTTGWGLMSGSVEAGLVLGWAESLHLGETVERLGP